MKHRIIHRKALASLMSVLLVSAAAFASEKTMTKPAGASG